MELARLELTLECEDPEKEPLGFYKSSLMHGYIMEMIDPEYAGRLHASPVNQFAQHIEKIGSRSKWIITTVNEEAKERVILPLLNKSGKDIYIRHDDTNLKVKGQELQVRSEDELMEETYFSQDVKKIIQTEFVTPASFKVSGRYQIYPTVRHIFQSLIRKHDAASENTKVYQDGLIEKIEEMVDIIGYDLRSAGFPMEGKRIPGFRGKVKMIVKGPAQLAALLRMLVKFGEYSGVGIKCAIGMGSVKLIG